MRAVVQRVSEAGVSIDGRIVGRIARGLPLYERFLVEISGHMSRLPAAGVFGAAMQVTLVNDGPVTIVIDSRDRE
jgi:D-Tyr-tRNAtyr deacylase